MYLCLNESSTISDFCQYSTEKKVRLILIFTASSQGDAERCSRY